MSSFSTMGVLALILTPVAGAFADAPPPPPPPENVWFGKGQFGFLSSSGNSQAQSLNTIIDLARIDGQWKNAFNVIGLYGKSTGIVSSEKWAVQYQANYASTADMFVFGGLRYEHDMFNGFQYQAAATSGLGYNIINTDIDKLTGQLGVGYRKVRPEQINRDPVGSGNVISRVPGDATGDAILTGGLDYLHKFSATTVFTNKFYFESGKSDTLLKDNLALTVKMSDKLAMSVGYGITDNTKPPAQAPGAAPLKKLDTITTLNVVFAF